MSVSVSVAGPYYSSGSISFSSLRTNFKETSSPGEIRASEYIRNTSIDATNAIVPDSTENSNISSGSNLRIGGFRNSIKYFNMRQSSTDLNFNINSQPWNGNLGKNIRKQLDIAGTCGSNSTGSPAAQLDSGVNIQITVNGSIYGAGGSAGGGSGSPGFAVYGTRNTSIIMGSGVIFAGGGGGGNGGGGADGPPALCFYSTGYNSTVCGGCPGCGADITLNCIPQPVPCNCRQVCTDVSEQIGSGKGSYTIVRTVCVTQCDSTVSIQYCLKKNYFYIPGGAGGSGGSGGSGQGYNQSRTSGGSGGGGSTSVCSGYNIGTVYSTTGGSGGNGGSGGDWGQPGEGGGSSGTALYGSNYTVSGANGSNVRGTYSAPPPLAGGGGSPSV